MIYAQPVDKYLDTTSKLQRLSLGEEQLKQIPIDRKNTQEAHNLNVAKAKGSIKDAANNRARLLLNDMGQAARWAMSAPNQQEQMQRYNQMLSSYRQSGIDTGGFENKPEYLPALAQFGTPTESEAIKFFETESGGLVGVGSKSGRASPVNLGGEKIRDKSPNTSIHLSGKAHMKATEEYSKGVGEDARTRVKAANEALGMNQQLDIIEAAIMSGAETGVGEESLVKLQSFLHTTFGIKPSKDVAAQELIGTIQKQMALRVRSPDSGLGLPGATSNRDLQFLQGTVPGLTRTKEGNLLLIDVYRRLNKIKLDTVAEQNRIIMENDGVVPMDLDDRIADYVANYPVFTEDEKGELSSIAKQAGQQSGNTTIDFSELPD